MNDQFIGKVIANKYRIESVLREGELGKTYRGTHVSMEKPVIIKVLSPALAVDENIAWQFSSEAKTASHISHPNILNVTDFGSDVNGAVYIIFEDAEGASLKEEIQTVGQFASDRALEIAVQTASALSFAHSKGKFHGALTSEKILLTNSLSGAESVKILDFGAVKSNAGNLLDEETNVGDVEYLAPEQCTDEGVGDERSDIYSLGVILYEMLAGEVPFKGEKPMDIMLKHSEEPPPPFSAFRQDLPAELEPVVLRALAKNPEMRYQTADEFAVDLKNVQRGFKVSETPVAAAATPVSNNNIWKTAFVVLAGISLLAIGLIYATSVKSTDPTTALQTDANGQPVQPINPATGTEEQNYANMSAMPATYVGNSNSMMMPPGTLTDGGGDGYNPWANGVQPPQGAPVVPYPVPQGGQVITIDPNNPNSPFMPVDTGNGVILVPVPANTTVVNANVKPSPTPKTPNANANVSATPAPNATPTPATPKATPTPKTAATPTAKPAETPKPDNKKPPASTEKRSESGKSQDAF